MGDMHIKVLAFRRAAFGSFLSLLMGSMVFAASGGWEGVFARYRGEVGASEGLLRQGKPQVALDSINNCITSWGSLDVVARDHTRGLWIRARYLKAFALFQLQKRQESLQALTDAMSAEMKSPSPTSPMQTDVGFFCDVVALLGSILGDGDELQRHPSVLAYFGRDAGGIDLMAVQGMDGPGTRCIVAVFRSNEVIEDNGEFCAVVVCRRGLAGSFSSNWTIIDGAKYHELTVRTGDDGKKQVVLSRNIRMGEERDEEGKLYMAFGLSRVVLCSKGPGPLEIVSSEVQEVAREYP